MKTNVGRLPHAWCDAKISEITIVNPTLDKAGIVDDLEVSFVPMPAVQAESGIIDVSGKRKFSEVKKGYMPFREGDVLFAKITPCMENGKMAIVPEVRNGLGFGSTEFHVLRILSGVNAKYVYYYVSSQAFRREVERNMSGAVGQRRVTTPYLNSCDVPLPPTNEQHRIVAKIEEMFSELDKGIENLKTAQSQLKVYRQALLKHAFEGKLTAQWRTENQDKLETADTLLNRIQQEREQRYQQQLADWEASGKQGRKPKVPKTLPPLTKEELAELPELPGGWIWIRLGDIFTDNPKNGIYKSADNYGSGFSIIRIDDFYDGVLCRTSGFKKIKLSADEIKTFTAYVGDILINRVNSIEYLGKCCEIRGLSEPVVFESNIMKVTLAANLASNFFVTSYLSSHLGRERLCANAKHAVNQASINQTDVSFTPIPLAQLDEQIVISELLGAYLSEADQLDQTIATSLKQTEALRQSILKKAFSGHLVPQDPDDEPASVLLNRIKDEKVRTLRKKRSMP